MFDSREESGAEHAKRRRRNNDDGHGAIGFRQELRSCRVKATVCVYSAS